MIRETFERFLQLSRTDKSFEMGSMDICVRIKFCRRLIICVVAYYHNALVFLGANYWYFGVQGRVVSNNQQVNIGYTGAVTRLQELDSMHVFCVKHVIFSSIHTSGYYEYSLEYAQ